MVDDHKFIMQMWVMLYMQVPNSEPHILLLWMGFLSLERKLTRDIERQIWYEWRLIHLTLIISNCLLCKLRFGSETLSLWNNLQQNHNQNPKQFQWIVAPTMRTIESYFIYDGSHWIHSIANGLPSFQIECFWSYVSHYNNVYNL